MPDSARDVVRHYFDHMGAGRHAQARSLLAPDICWWVVGEGAWSFGGWHDRESMRRIAERVRQRFPAGLAIQAKRLTADGDRVAVEAESQGLRSDGFRYHNQYVFVFEARDGLIVSSREFCDVFHAKDAFFGDLAPASAVGDGSRNHTHELG